MTGAEIFSKNQINYLKTIEGIYEVSIGKTRDAKVRW